MEKTMHQRMLEGELYIAADTERAEMNARAQGWEMAYPITIGEHVWIGGAAIICPRVTIGFGTTIGAGSVVTRDIPAGVFAVGNPCRVIRRLHGDEREVPR